MVVIELFSRNRQKKLVWWWRETVAFQRSGKEIHNRSSDTGEVSIVLQRSREEVDNRPLAFGKRSQSSLSSVQEKSIVLQR